MIKLTDKFKTEWDGRQWVLHETYQGTNKKTGEPKDQARESYHGTLRQACKNVVDASMRDCGDAAAIITVIENAGWVLEGKAAGYIK